MGGFQDAVPLPASGHSSFWKLLGAEPRTRCGGGCSAPAPLPPSTLWPGAGTRGSRAPTGSRPPRPAEPRGNFQMTGGTKGSSSRLRLGPRPASRGGPSEEARSSGPAWHRRVPGGRARCAAEKLLKAPPASLIQSPWMSRPPRPPSVLGSEIRRSSGAVPLGVPETHMMFPLSGEESAAAERSAENH